MRALRSVLSRAAETAEGDYLDVDDGSPAIAAAEIVAAARGGSREGLPKQAATWLDVHAATVTAEDVELARRAVQRVFGENSELRSLWEGHGPDSAWHVRVRLLLQRLG